ncbi:hypothetical protein HPB50_011489 [Hyalomma asiaticum]|uniref:Uncharacterized protein n=1 Tax=Hyalomma asiaticum TaxID=266040 RepID=A0ACB7RTN6_HYAAI|nr:hypothetical protein HPB50_011489 [Hyalomma asiaticum]
METIPAFKTTDGDVDSGYRSHFCVSCQLPSCNMPMDMGSCTEASTYYYYDKFARTCKPFAYGGFGGNYNRFPSFGDCMEKCHTVG